MNFISAFFNKGHARTIKAKKNIFASLFIKGSSILIGLILMPLALEYVDQMRYGIWVTVASFITWFAFFDIGLGSGLKNKLTESFANNDTEESKTLVSTTYALIIIVSFSIGILFFLINPILDWTKILNTPIEMQQELSSLALIVFGFFFLRFVFQLIGVVLMADQRPAINNLFGPLGNLIGLLVILILLKTTEGSLIYLGYALSASPVLVLFIASIYFFNTRYATIKPSIRYVKLRHAKGLASLGIKFFLIKIAALVIFQTSNIVIAQYFGPAEVTPYNFAFKYFAVIYMLFTIIIAPYWAAFTDAWVKKEFAWIRNAIKKLNIIWLGIAFIAVIMLIFSDQVYYLWVGDKVNIPFKLSAYMAIYFVLFSFGGIYNMFINGVGKVVLQIVSLSVGALVFLPCTYLFINVFHFGVEGVIIAMIVANFYLPVIAPIQYYKIINNKATGIWNK